MRNGADNRFPFSFSARVFRLVVGVWVFGYLGICGAAAPPASIPEAAIASLQEGLATPGRRGDSAVAQRLALKNVVRRAQALIDAAPDAQNRFAVLAVIFEAQKRLMSLEATGKNREALFEICRKLLNAPEEYVELRLEADLLLSERDLAARNATVEERVAALEQMLARYRGTAAEQRSLTIAALVAHKLMAFDLEKEISGRLASSSFGGDHKAIAFRRKAYSVRSLDAVFSGTYETAGGSSVAFPFDRLGHQYLVVFWSKQPGRYEGYEKFLGRIRDQQERFPGRFEVYSFNLDDLPDAGKSILLETGVKATALRLPAGRSSSAYGAYGLMDPVAIFVNAQGHVWLQWGQAVPWPKPMPARGNGAAKPGPGLGMWLDDERYLAQLRSLFIGDFLVEPFSPMPGDEDPIPNSQHPTPQSGATIPLATRKEIQSCFTPVPFRYRLTRDASLANYRKAEKLCADALRSNPESAERRRVRNARIIALLGMWNLAVEPTCLDEAVEEAKRVLEWSDSPGDNVVARFCLATEALRKGAASPESVLNGFIAAEGGDQAPAMALAAAAVLAIEANAEALYRGCRQRLLGLKDEEHPVLWPVLSFMRDRNHDYRLFWGNPGRWGYTRKQRYWVKYRISGLGAPAETNRVFTARLQTLDGQALRFPRETAGKMTGVLFAEPPADDSDRSPWVKRVKDFADRFTNEDVPVVVAFLSEDTNTVRSLVKDAGGAFRAAMVPGGFESPLVRRLGILSADRIPNPFLLLGDGTIAWSTSGLTYPINGGSTVEGTDAASIGINIEKRRTDLAFELLQRGDFRKALLLLDERLPPKRAADPWTSDRLQGRALAHMGLNDWEAALAEIDAAIARRIKDSRYGARVSPGNVEQHVVRATILRKLGRTRELEKETALVGRDRAWLETAPESEYPPSYARNGIPVGVYDDLLKGVRLELEGKKE